MKEISTEQRAQVASQRIDRLRQILERRGAAAMKLSQRRDFSWLTLGGLNHVLLSSETGVAPIVLTPTDAVVLAPVNEYDRIADEEVAGLPLRVVSLPWWDDAASERETSSLASGGIVLSADDVAPELEELRTVLHTIERQRMAAIAELVNDAMSAALAEVEPGEREHELGARISQRLAAAGARLPVILVAADDRIERYRHPIPTDTRINGRVMVVVVAEQWGLHVAATKFRELEPRSREIERRAAAVDDVAAAMRDATRPGNTFGDVLAAARSAYAHHGMADQWELHHQGGSIGYAGRERIAKPDDETPIRGGMAFAWNPSAVGYKAEETLLLDENGRQTVLTTTA